MRALLLLTLRLDTVLAGFPYYYPCSSCVFVNANTGNDATGDGSYGNPYQTISQGEANPNLYDGMVLIGNFDIGSYHSFVNGWSYTGHGTATVLQVNGGDRYVAGNSFHRLVFDFNHVHEDVSFRGNGAVGFHNVVFKDQHSTHGSRELIAGTDSTICLTLENCLLYDVEWNKWVLSYPNSYQITNSVSSNCGSKFIC